MHRLPNCQQYTLEGISNNEDAECKISHSANLVHITSVIKYISTPIRHTFVSKAFALSTFVHASAHKRLLWEQIVLHSDCARSVISISDSLNIYICTPLRVAERRHESALNKYQLHRHRDKNTRTCDRLHLPLAFQLLNSSCLVLFLICCIDS